MNAERADRIADRIAEEGVFMLGRLHDLALLGVGRRQDQRPVQRKRHRRREEEGHGDHMRGIVVEVQILISDVRHPIEMAENAIRETVPPGAQKHRPHNNQRDIGENGDRERERHMVAHAQFAADFHFAQRP